MVEQKISLDFAKNGVQKTVHARQGENAARDILISLTANGEPVDVSEYTMKVIYPDGTHTLLEASNPVKVTIPQQMCVEVGEKVCEVQIAEDSEEGAILYSPQFRVLVEGTILGASGSSEPIGDPTVYQPLIAGLEPYPSSTLGANAKIPVYDPAENGTKLVDPAILHSDITELEEDVAELEEDVASLKSHLQAGDYTAPTFFRATATISQGKITEVTLDNDKTMGDIFLVFSRGTPAYIGVHDNNDTELFLATFKGYWLTEDDSGFVFESEYGDSAIMLVAPTDEDEDTLTCTYIPDYTTAEKNKLSGIESGAEVNALTDVVDSNGDSLVSNRVAHIPASAAGVVDIYASGGGLAYTFAQIETMFTTKTLLYNERLVVKVNETATMPENLRIFYIAVDPYNTGSLLLKCATYSDQSTRTSDDTLGRWSEQNYTYEEKTKLGNLPSNAESVTNKVTSLSAQSTDTQYPSAKCIYDLIGGLDDLIGTGVIE